MIVTLLAAVRVARMSIPSRREPDGEEAGAGAAARPGLAGQRPPSQPDAETPRPRRPGPPPKPRCRLLRPGRRSPRPNPRCHLFGHRPRSPPGRGAPQPAPQWWPGTPPNGCLSQGWSGRMSPRRSGCLSQGPDGRLTPRRTGCLSPRPNGRMSPGRLGARARIGAQGGSVGGRARDGPGSGAGRAAGQSRTGPGGPAANRPWAGTRSLPRTGCACSAGCASRSRPRRMATPAAKTEAA